MPSTIELQIRQEVDLVHRFTDSYRRKFATVIRLLNEAAAPDAQAQCVRLCVEAVDMMLLTQTRLAGAIQQLAEARPVRPAAPGLLPAA